MKVRSLLSSIFGVFFPFCCHICKTETAFGKVICPACNNKFKQELEKPFLVGDVKCSFPVYAMSAYSDVVSDVVKIVKYRPSRKLLAVAINNLDLLGVSKSDVSRPDVVLAVPMHQRRMAQRGFNQAEVLAQGIAAILQIPYSPVLVRTRNTRAQADCNQEERLTNLNNAFSLADGIIPLAFTDKHLLLVDDVATTGTTLEKCAQPLKKLNPAKISSLVLSHSFRKHPDVK